MSDRITWQTENTELPQLNCDMLSRWIDAVARSYNRMIGELNYIFCDDETILRVNREFLQHDYYTDIITFDYCRGRMLRGDMYISLDTVTTNAQGVGDTYFRELHRVIIHGVLHLCGINDKGPGEREIMEAAEDRALSILDELLKQQ